MDDISKFYRIIKFSIYLLMIVIIINAHHNIISYYINYLFKIRPVPI